MSQRPMQSWERKLRQMGRGLVDSISNIFGSREAAPYRPPKPPRQPESGQPSGDHAHTAAHSSGKADRLPPRERRGRD